MVAAVSPAKCRQDVARVEDQAGAKPVPFIIITSLAVGDDGDRFHSATGKAEYAVL